MTGVGTWYPSCMERKILFFVFFALTSVFFPEPLEAQALPSLPSTQSLPSFAQSSIVLIPQAPEPGQQVTAKLNAYAENTTGATIQWFLDGVELTEYRNEREMIFTAGDLGETQRLSVRVSLLSGSPLVLEEVIVPSRVDLIIEADTTVPTVYRGRALPSIGSTVRAVALVDTKAATDPSLLTYSWQLNNKQLNRGSQVGGNVTTFTVPWGQQFSVSVAVSDTNGRTIAQQKTIVNPADPEIYFYENNPLRGVAQNAILSTYQLIGDEVTVRAEPFFMNQNIFTKRHQSEWQINYSAIDNPSEDPQNITLRKSGGNGNFRVSYHMRNLEELLQGADGEFTVAF